jgi:YVTN family beta-propeller protein
VTVGDILALRFRNKRHLLTERIYKMLTHIIRSRGCSLTATYLRLLFVGACMSAAIATSQAQTRAYVTFVALTPDDTRLYVSNASNPITIGTLDVIDTATNTVIATIPTPDFCPFGIAIAPLIPRSKDDCKNDGYLRFRSLGFRNQGQGIKYVNEHTD